MMYSETETVTAVVTRTAITTTMMTLVFKVQFSKLARNDFFKILSFQQFLRNDYPRKRLSFYAKSLVMPATKAAAPQKIAAPVATSHPGYLHQRPEAGRL